MTLTEDQVSKISAERSTNQKGVKAEVNLVSERNSKLTSSAGAVTDIKWGKFGTPILEPSVKAQLRRTRSEKNLRKTRNHEPIGKSSITKAKTP